MIHVSRRLGVAAVAAATVVGVGLFAASSTAGEDRYRTVAATRGDVEQIVSYDGTIAASQRSDPVFATDGTVRKVAVEVGDEVEAGDVLATLDASDLKAAVIETRADLADAEAYLDDVEDGQIDTVARASGGGGSATESSATDAGTVTLALYTESSSSPMTFASTSDRLKDALAELAAEQETVKSARSAATDAITAAKAALAAQQAACEEDDPATATAISQECRDALTAVQEAQDVVAEQQDALQSALEALGSTLGDAVKQLEKDAGSADASGGSADTKDETKEQDSGKAAGQDRDSGGTTSQTPGQGAQPDAGSSGPGSGAGSSSGTTATAADLASAQADVDTAEAALTSAKTDLAAATLTAPFDGTVMSVGIAAGDEVSTSDAALVLIGEGDTTATVSVPVDDLAAIEVGQAATVTPGSATAARGTVSAVGLVPEASDEQASATTYSVTVTLDDDLAAPEGSAAVVAIVTGTASDVVTVPASAVTRRTATQGSVLVLADGEVERRQVTLGTMGATSAAVTEGVDKGEQVVVADLEAALPSSDEASTRSLTGGGRGGPPSGGGMGGGRPPG
ncbi:MULTISPECIES: HlyD family efflux transporter periplasmic adaptor subunit [Aeromicrobium]|uniref:HlyD family efflux transporter periplasmic adaptor subunit n=1 Tax=Aeromicrobium TaxID=2040 RepID=UPI00258075D6|nr:MULTISPECIES: biotin/lipoyl-binding protein [Aeromicrobium]